MTMRILFAIAGFSAFAFTILFFAHSAASRFTLRLLQDLVHHHSNGTYLLHSDDIGIHPGRQELRLYNARFYLNPEKTVNSNTDIDLDNTTYEAFAPEMRLRVESFWDIYFKKQLKIKSLYMQGPQMEFNYLREAKERTDISFRTGNLYNLISEYLQIFQISEFELNSGRFRFGFVKDDVLNNFTIDNLSFNIKNFMVDSVSYSDENRFLYTDDLRISIKNQEIELPDSVNLITFDQLDFSTFDSTIQVKNFRLRSRVKKDASLEESDIYDVHVPSFKLGGIDFPGAYHQNMLNVDLVKLISPEIITEQKPRESIVEDEQDEAIIKNRIAQLANDYFERINVGSFDVENARLDLLDWKKLRSRQFTFDSLDFKLSNLVIDSSNYATSNRVYNFDAVELVIRNYNQRLADSIHAISVDIVKAYSLTQTISAENFRLAAFRDVEQSLQIGEGKSKDQYDVYIPHFLLSGFDLKKILYEDTIRVRNAIFTDPEVKLMHLPGRTGNQKKESQSVREFYATTDELGLSVYLANIDVRNGKFEHFQPENTEPIAVLEGINLQLLNLAFDSLTVHGRKMQRRELMRLHINEGRMQLGKKRKSLQFENLRYSTREESMSIEWLNLDDPNSQTADDEYVFALTRAGARIAGLNLSRMIYDQEIEADTLFIRLPDVSFEASPESKGNDNSIINKPIHLPDDVSIGTIVAEVDMVNLNWQRSNWLNITKAKIVSNIGLDDKQIDQIKLFEGDFTISGQEFYYQHPTKKQHANGQDFIYNKAEGTLAARNIAFNSIGGQLLEKTEINVKIPEINIKGIDPERFSLDTIVAFNSFDAPNVEVNITMFRNNILKSAPEPPKKINTPGFVNQIIADKLSFENLKLNYQLIDGKDTTHISTFISDLSGFDLDFESTDKLDGKLPVKSYHLKADYLNQSDSKGNAVRIDSITYHSENGVLRTGSVKLANTETKDEAKSTSQINLEKFSVPGLHITGLDAAKGLFTQEWKFDNADILQPQISVVVKPGDKQTDIFALPSEASKNKKKPHHISGDVNFVSGKLTMVIDLDTAKIPIKFDDFSLSLDALDLSKRAESDVGKLFFSQNSALMLKSVSIDLPDSLNTLKIGAIDFNQEDSVLQIKNIEIVPRYSRLALGQQRDYQIDWIKIYSKELLFRGIDIPRAIKDREIMARSLSIDSLHLEVFRDKRLKFDEEQTKNLPHELFRKQGRFFSIDTVIATRSRIIYEEFPIDGSRPAVILFGNVNAVLTPLTNDVDLLNKVNRKGRSILTMNGKLMDSGNIDARVVFDINSKNDHFTLTGKMGAFDLTKLNPLTEALASVNIRSGQVESLQMEATANDDFATGEMRFRYQGLRVQVLNRKNQQASGMGPAITTFFANTFVLRKNNNKPILLRKGDIFFERDKSKTIFNYWSKIFFSGIVSSVGAKSHKKDLKKLQKDRLENLKKEEK